MIALETLRDRIWVDGRAPHIMFDPRVPEEAYWPGATEWNRFYIPGAPTGVRTSGIVQPTLDGWAALAVAQRGRANEARAFLERIYWTLVQQHDYLATHR